MLSEYQKERQSKICFGKEKAEEKKVKKISIKSVKRQAEEKLYLRKKKDYLIKHPKCEVKECNKVSEDVHHKKGREGKLLYDERYFFACCRQHHTEIETHPDWAIKNGYSLKRLTIED